MTGAALLTGAVTLIANAGNATDSLPSVTLMTIPALVPATVGAVPESWPVAALNTAQAGLFWMLKVSGSPLASAAVGLKL